MFPRKREKTLTLRDGEEREERKMKNVFNGKRCSARVRFSMNLKLTCHVQIICVALKSVIGYIHDVLLSFE